MTVDTWFWDGIAEEYAAKPVDLPDAYQRKLDHTRSKLHPEARLLDVGCGTGSTILTLSEEVAEAHGLDVSPQMMRIAREKAVAQGVDNAFFHVGAFGEDLPFDDESFDVVCAYSILHLVANRQQAIRRLYRLTKPGGWFIASTACLGQSWVPYGLILPVMRMVGKAPAVWVVSKAQLEAEIRDAGFVDLTAPEVGAAPATHFTIARKPA